MSGTQVKDQAALVCTCNWSHYAVLAGTAPDDMDLHPPTCPMSREAAEDPSDDPEYQAYLAEEWHRAAVVWAEENGLDPLDPDLDEMYADHEVAWAEAYAEDAMWDRGC